MDGIALILRFYIKSVFFQIPSKDISRLGAAEVVTLETVASFLELDYRFAHYPTTFESGYDG